MTKRVLFLARHADIVDPDAAPVFCWLFNEDRSVLGGGTTFTREQRQSIDTRESRLPERGSRSAIQRDASASAMTSPMKWTSCHVS